MTSFSLFDANRPQDGAVITGQEVRDLIKSVATGSAGSTPPGGVAVLIGDARFSVASIATRYKLSITINGTAATVNLQPYATRSTVTPTQVVTAINASFSALGTVAYVYSEEAYDSSAFIALVAPKPASGSSSITVAELTDGTDASETILGLQGRGKVMPLTITSAAVPYGTQWLNTSNGDDDALRMYLGSPARATGLLDLGDGLGTLNLSVQTSMRIKVVTPSASFGPLTISVKGASPAATTPEEIVTNINTAFLAQPGWPSVSVGPARLVTRNGYGKYLQIVSGPVDNPSTGPGAAVELSGLAAGGVAGVNFLVDDAISLVMGLPRGLGDKKFDKIPHVFTGSDFSTNFIRGIGNRSGPGIGVWGPPLESKIDLPLAGVSDGEKRTDKATGIDWIYRQSQNLLQGAGWTRAIPGYEYPLSYNKFSESYRLKTATDSFVPQPLSRGAYDAARSTTGYVQIAPGNLQTGIVGDALTLVDGRDFLWKDGTYPDGRNHFDTAAIYDNFPTARYRLGRTRDGLNWLALQDTNTPTITGTNSQRLRPVSSGIAATAAIGASTLAGVRAYVDGAGIVRQANLTLSSSTTTTVTFTIPDVSAALPLRPRSFSIRIANGGAANIADDVTGHADVVAVGNWRAYDDGTAGVGGVYGITGSAGISGTVHPTTGAVSITFPVVSANASPGVADFYRIVYAYSQTNLLVVAVDVRKSGELRSAGTVAEAGLIYGATANAGSGVDLGSGFLAIVRDDGSGGVFSMASGVPTAVGAPFLIDPPLDDTWRTLRVLFQVEPGVPSFTAVHAVFWNGSNRPCDWIAKDYANPEAGLTADQTNGGIEVDRIDNKLAAIATRTAGLDPNESGFYTGIYGKGASAGGGYTEKVVQFRNFQSHGGHKTNFTEVVPALPPVSGIRLRDSINAIQLLKNGAAPNNAIISDCTAATPLQVNLLGDLANTESQVDLGSGGRKLDVAYRTLPTLAKKDQRYLRQDTYLPGTVGALGIPERLEPTPGVFVYTNKNYANPNGTFAVWDLSAMLVDHALTGADPQNGNYTSAPQSGAAPRNIRSSFYLGEVGDGMPGKPALNTVTGRPHRYWNPGVADYLGAFPGPSSIISSATLLPFQNQTNVWRTVQVTTTLPNTGANGIDWVYVVERADITHIISPYLMSNYAVTGPDWVAQGPSTVWSGGPFRTPIITNVERIAGSGPYAAFSIDIYYYGPVRPDNLSLVIKAYRRGTEV